MKELKRCSITDNPTIQEYFLYKVTFVILVGFYLWIKVLVKEYDDMHFFKYYIDISKDEQKERLEAKKDDPLKQWKLSPIDKKAQKMWHAYSKSRDAMFVKTDFLYALWHIIHTNSKKKVALVSLNIF
jgi:polyphosphate kinase 2 (PPK2 family)